VKVVALAAAALLAPTFGAAPPRAPKIVTVAVGHDRAIGFVAGNERVVTVAHVVGDEVKVDGRPATIVRVDERNDLALLRVAGLGGERPRFGGGDGTTVLGRAAPIARRIRARVDGGPRRAVLELRSEVAVGDSGAPVIGADGRVAGVVFARSRTRDVGYAVEGSAVAALLRQANVNGLH
jgi:hypothetical protein